MKITRNIVVLLILVATISFVAGVDWSAPGTFYTGSAAVFDGVDAFQASGTDTNGIIFSFDGNTVCFNGTDCDLNIDWNGEHIIINGPV